MALRCLLFSSNEAMVQSICEVLAGLGIEGEYCGSAVDAVEKVTTQLFQIVITDWDDQPEAGFLLKTARDLKAAQRPLTLAIVSDAGMPQALQAGANSVLLKPIRREQVQDTMTTACQLLRAKQQPAGVVSVAAATTQKAPEAVALAAAAASGAVSAPVSLTQGPEKLRAGEFLQSPMSAPGGQFDTESEVASMEPAVAPVDALSELEPMAAAVDTAPAEQPKREEPVTGWAMLQARLTKPAPPAAEPTTSKSDLLSYAESQPTAAPEAALPAENGKAPADKKSQQQEAALFAYMSADAKAHPESTERTNPKRGKVFVASALAACLVLAAVPRTRQSMVMIYRNGIRGGSRWLNPPPAALPQAVAQHDSFGQSGDEYKLPAPGNIPDATTDPSTIRVLPVVDPTAKPDKNAPENAAQPQRIAVENSTDQSQSSNPGTQVQVEQKDQAPASVADGSGNQAGGTVPVRLPPQVQIQQIPAAISVVTPETPATTAGRTSSTPQIHSISVGANAGIPSSLKSQLASSTPEASGTKSLEAAMSSIEPVSLPEPAARELLAQTVDPEYPAAGKAGGQRGSVVLQVQIGRDGVVQDAKFLQGSLVFARAAIDAVKQWRFKPYLMNGRAVSVQCPITLNFKPPA